MSLMTPNAILELYMLQSENVRALKKVFDGIKQDINFEIRKSNQSQIFIKTKLLTMVYSAWSEAQFVQILYTPLGFRPKEIIRLKKVRKDQGIAVAWREMVTVALSKVGDVSKREELKLRLDKLLGLIKEYIEEPATLRNKLAHGQWVVALNSDCTARNSDLTSELSNLDPVVVEKRFRVHSFLGHIVRDLVQSPKNGFHQHYYTNICNLEQYIEQSKSWSLASKKAELLRKPTRYAVPRSSC